MNTLFTQNFPENLNFREQQPNKKIKGQFSTPTQQLRLAKMEKSINAPAILLVVGVLSLLIYIPIGFTIILPAMAWLFNISPDYVVLMDTLRGEEIIFKSKDKEEVVAFSQKVRKTFKKLPQKENYQVEPRIPFLNV